MRLFEKDSDYQAFEQVMAEVCERVPMRILSYCLMPNHWHLVLWPWKDGDLSDFIRLLTLTHTQRWHAHHRTTGSGHLYQGRFKSFVVQNDEHLLTVCRYVERNALRAKIVERAEDWRWSSVARRKFGDSEAAALLSEWPVPTPRDWLAGLNHAETKEEIAALRLSVNRGRPFGNDAWVLRAAQRLGLMSTMRRRGRPPKGS
jgi:putative transposase